MPKILLSYRRSDAMQIAGRIFDRLVSRYGPSEILGEIDGTPPGVDFQQHIHDIVGRCEIMLVIVGPDWLGRRDASDCAIQHEYDPIRIELEVGLQRRLRVVPILVDGARMPAQSELPSSLRNFVYLNALEVSSGPNFNPHIDRLIRMIDSYSGMEAHVHALPSRASNGTAGQTVTQYESLADNRSPTPGTPSTSGREGLRSLQVFISYTTKDILTAEALCSALEQAGVGCWMAPRNLTLGGDTEKEIVATIAKSQVFLLIFSSHTLQSKKTLREVALAASKNLPTILFRIDDSTPTAAFAYHFAHAVWIDAFGTSDDQRLRSLLDVMSGFADGRAEQARISLVHQPNQIAPGEAIRTDQRTSSVPMKIIISYRRSDSSGIAGRLFDRFKDRFGANSVYMDIDSIPFGTNFRLHIDHALSESRVLIAIIGPNWLGRRRLFRSRIFDQNDPVRIEVETAFRKQVPIIPVLLDGTAMPSPSQIPKDLKDFSELNAAELSSGRDFDVHAERLMGSVEKVLNKDKS